MDRTWSPQQQTIFGWFKSGRGNLVVRARAGTGKTTTIMEGLTHAPERSILLAAFNKRIALELQQKLRNPNATAQTLHAVGFAMVRRYWTGVRIDGDRGARLARDVAGEDAPDAMVRLVAKLAGLGKNMAPFGSERDLVPIAEEFDCVPDEEWEDDGWDVDRVVELAGQAIAHASDRDGTIDFDDMLFLPLVQRWCHGRYDLVCIDEAQDMNAAQIELARRVARPGGRIVVVGDDRQAIYGFRGADSGSIDRLKAELQAAEMPLTVTYRCGRTIVDIARKMVPDYEAAPNNPPGEVLTVGEQQMVRDAQPGDFILSRKNAPLVKLCLQFLKAGRPAKIEGKDIGAGLIAIVKKLKARSMPELLEKLERWVERQVARAEKTKNPQERIEMVHDQADTLRAVAEGLAGPMELEGRLHALFSDDHSGAKVVLSSVHKAKGLEADRVYVLEDTLKHKPGAPGAGEEANIAYVAVTRAKRTLVWVKPVPPPAPLLTTAPGPANPPAPGPAPVVDVVVATGTAGEIANKLNREVN